MGFCFLLGKYRIISIGEAPHIEPEFKKLMEA